MLCTLIWCFLVNDDYDGIRNLGFRWCHTWSIMWLVWGLYLNKWNWGFTNGEVNVYWLSGRTSLEEPSPYVYLFTFPGSSKRLWASLFPQNIGQDIFRYTGAIHSLLDGWIPNNRIRKYRAWTCLSLEVNSPPCTTATTF